MKFIEMSRQSLSEIDKGLSNFYFRSRYNFLLPYSSQFRTKRLTFCESPN